MWFLCHRIEHLGLNVVLQLLVGVPLEMVHGAARIGLVYVAGVLAGTQGGPQASRAYRGLPTSPELLPTGMVPCGKPPRLPRGWKGAADHRGRSVMERAGVESPSSCRPAVTG